MKRRTVSERILAIRASAGNPCETCPTCGKAPDAPYRRTVAGRIIEGCVDATHEGRLTGNSADWYNQPCAVTFRRNELTALLALREPVRAASRIAE